MCDISSLLLACVLLFTQPTEILGNVEQSTALVSKSISKSAQIHTEVLPKEKMPFFLRDARIRPVISAEAMQEPFFLRDAGIRPEVLPEAIIVPALYRDTGEQPEDTGETVSGNNGVVNSGNSGGTAEAVDRLYIDGNVLYEGMDKTYAQGYIPQAANGSVRIVLPLEGQTYDGKAAVTMEFATVEESPFVFGNYAQTLENEDGSYVFIFEIPLVAGYVNGIYPVTLKADYLNTAGNLAQQIFTVYVTVSDGIERPVPDADTAKEVVEAPKLFVSACEILSDHVGGEEEFTVDITVENIGAIRARSVLLTYGSDTGEIFPAQANNWIHIKDIDGGKSETYSLVLKTAKDVLAGNRPFYMKLEYTDLFGGSYTETQTFFVQVTQPGEMGYDPVNIPGQVISGDTFTVPVNVFNTGKSTLHNVSAMLSGSGLFPLASAFLGDISPGQAEGGEIEIYVGTLSLSGNTFQEYGRSDGTYRITYTDDSGEIHSAETNFSTEIIRPVAEDSENPEEKEAAIQWWGSVLAALAVIAILTASIVVTRLTRIMRMNLGTAQK